MNIKEATQMTDKEEEYITLFCEGDGGIYVTPKGHPKVFFGQKECEVLEYVNSLMRGGHINRHGSNAWQLMYYGKYCMPLLEIFSRHVVGKDFLDRLNKVLKHVDMPLAIQHPLTLEGFIAFWDAEGSSANNPQIVVSQKDREVLDLITGMHGGGVSRLKGQNGEWHHHWYLCGEKARKLYKIILEKSHCPEKAERLRENFEGLRYFEHKDRMKAHYDAHKAEYKARNKKCNEEQRAIRDYFKTHPKEATKLGVNI